MSDPTRKRRRVQFSLRTLFIAVTAICLLVGWGVYQRNWIRLRHDFLEELRSKQPWIDDNGGHLVEEVEATPNMYAVNNRSAPWSLRIFGEEKQSQIVLYYHERDERERLAEIWKEIEYAQRLFPEADVYPVCQDAWTPREVRPLPVR